MIIINSSICPVEFIKLNIIIYLLLRRVSELLSLLQTVSCNRSNENHFGCPPGLLQCLPFCPTVGSWISTAVKN